MPELEGILDLHAAVPRARRSSALRRQLPATLLVAASVVFASAGQLGIKLGLRTGAGPWNHAPHPLHAPFTWGVLSGLLLYGVGTLLWIAAVSRGNISYLYPLAALNYILVALGGHILLHEPILAGRWVGLVIMCCGIALLVRVAPEPRP